MLFDAGLVTDAPCCLCLIYISDLSQRAKDTRPCVSSASPPSLAGSLRLFPGPAADQSPFEDGGVGGVLGESGLILIR